MTHNRSPNQDALASQDEVEPQVGVSVADSPVVYGYGFDTYAVLFRAHFAQRDAATSASYNDYRPVYRYGYDLGTDDRYRRADWVVVEQAARPPWEARNPGTWEHFRDLIRYAWCIAGSSEGTQLSLATYQRVNTGAGTMKTVVGLFDERGEAQRVYDDLAKNGFKKNEITLVTKGSTGLDSSTGIPQSDLNFYQEGVQQGGSLVVARVDDGKATGAAEIMARYNIVDVDARVAQLRQTNTNVGLRDYTDDDHVLPVIEEQLQVGKRTVERGRMRVYSTVTETPVEQQVTLRDETLNVERHAVNRDLTSADMANAFKDQTFEVTETDEEAVVSKSARVTEEVRIGTQASEHTETVRDTVRRTDVGVEELPSSGAVGETTSTRTVNASSTGAKKRK